MVESEVAPAHDVEAGFVFVFESVADAAPEVVLEVEAAVEPEVGVEAGAVSVAAVAGESNQAGW